MKSFALERIVESGHVIVTIRSRSRVKNERNILVKYIIYSRIFILNFRPKE